MFALARTLLLADAVGHEAIGQALLTSARTGGSFVRALLSTGAIDAQRLALHLERGSAPYMHQIAPVTALVEVLPAGLCERLLAVPVRRDPMTGTIDVAVVDARDPHPVAEIAYWLSAPVRMVHTSLSAMDAALDRLSAKPERGVRSLAPPIWAPTADEAPPHTPRYGRSLLPAQPGADESVAIIELGPPAIERLSPPPDAEIPAPMTVRGPFLDAAAPDEDSAGPTVRGPFTRIGSTSAVPREPEVPGLRAILQATDRDGILDGLVGGVRAVARRVGIFILRREGLVGWTCTPELAEASAFRGLRWPPSSRTVLRNALSTEGVSLVRVPTDALHAALAAIVGAAPGESPGEVALTPVQVHGKGMAVVLADGIDDPLIATERLQALSKAAGDALERLLRERRDRPSSPGS